MEELKLEDLEKILDIAREFNMKEDEGRCYNSIGLRYHKAGKYNEALKNYEKALKIADEIADINIKGKILNNIAYIKWSEGDYQTAKKYFEESIDIYEIFIGEIKTAVEKIDITEEFNPYYGITQLLFDLYKKTKNKENLYEALKYIELGKSTEIIEILQLFQIIEKYPSKNIELVKKEKKLVNEMFLIKEEINDLNKRKRELWGLLQKYKHFDDQKTIEETIQKLEQEVINLEDQIEEKNQLLLNLGKESRKLRSELVLKLEDPKLIKLTRDYNPKKDLLRLFEIENVVVWELFYVPNALPYQNNFNVVVVDSKDINLYQVENFDGKKFFEAYRLFYRMITDPVLKYQSFENLIEIKNMITEILPSDLLDSLENKSKLIILPHNVLHLIPWEIIDPVGLKLPICRNYSINMLMSCINTNDASIQGNELFFINNPTFNSYPVTIAEREIGGITKLLKDYKIPHVILAHEEATKDKFLEIIKNKKIGVIHFGGYANFDPLNKMGDLSQGASILEKNRFTGLLFYDEKNYSLLNINELINIGLEISPILVMNIVELGEIEDPMINNLVVLLRGLILAGISSIILPNWYIMENITPDFMLEFYHGLSSEIDVCESLFESRKKIWATLKRPVFYGAYSLFGNPFKKVKFD
ncbi:MAG: CHAT domain-containing protein [Candidatus Helarchaeota archaeon]